MSNELVKVILVSGLAGAGRSSILRALEDLGYQAVDNLPLTLLPALVEQSRKEGARLAVGIDTRSKGFDPDCMLRLLEEIRSQTGSAHLVVATAANDILLRRYTETRRRHPLAPEGQVIDGIMAERDLIASLQAAADLVIDTSDLPLAGLRPREADMVFDARFLRNPHYDQALRPLTGLDSRVAAYVEADTDFEAFFGKITGLLELLLPRFTKEGKKYAVIAVGCSGGRHRSVHIVQRLAQFLKDFASLSEERKADKNELEPEWKVSVIHRELAKADTIQSASTPAREA
jgi:UPF0042 nucleotide-binding protein